MISLCSAIVENSEDYLPTFFESILSYTDNVKEVVLVKVDAEKNGYEDWLSNGVLFKKYDTTIENKFGHGHALGLHYAIKKATQDYILFSDPDVFFSTVIDNFYLKMMNENDLDFVGISHHAAIVQCYTFFPCVTNALVRKNNLPNGDFLGGLLKFRGDAITANCLKKDISGIACDGKYLIEGPIPEKINLFPNQDPTSRYDVGCNLYLWSLEKKWKWLAFQTTDCHTYSTNFHRGNIKIGKIKKQKLLYHATAGGLKNTIENFKEKYEKLKKDTDD